MLVDRTRAAARAIYELLQGSAFDWTPECGMLRRLIVPANKTKVSARTSPESPATTPIFGAADLKRARVVLRAVRKLRRMLNGGAVDDAWMVHLPRDVRLFAHNLPTCSARLDPALALRAAEDTSLSRDEDGDGDDSADERPCKDADEKKGAVDDIQPPPSDDLDESPATHSPVCRKRRRIGTASAAAAATTTEQHESEASSAADAQVEPDAEQLEDMFRRIFKLASPGAEGAAVGPPDLTSHLRGAQEGRIFTFDVERRLRERAKDATPQAFLACNGMTDVDLALLCTWTATLAADETGLEEHDVSGMQATFGSTAARRGRPRRTRTHVLALKRLRIRGFVFNRVASSVVDHLVFLILVLNRPVHCASGALCWQLLRVADTLHTAIEADQRDILVNSLCTVLACSLQAHFLEIFARDRSDDADPTPPVHSR